MNLIEAWKLFKMVNTSATFAVGSRRTNVSSTYRCHSHTPLCFKGVGEGVRVRVGVGEGVGGSI